ncbi:hypothetical protein MNB_SV-9-1321 [hydrothermal vent metagenome]|uniref:Uncharacterized protein n=1 Tax=hydrothermal vent metagenome TaxID=652676 RepID=A0A1W1CD19_9ZZZZ
MGLVKLLVAGAIVFFILIVGINKFKSEDERLMSKSQLLAQEDQKGYKRDVVGDTVLIKIDAPLSKRIDIWKRSPMHEEFLSYFPKFEDMKLYVDDIVKDDELKSVIIKQLKSVEDDFFSGSIGDFEAKEKIDKI